MILRGLADSFPPGPGLFGDAEPGTARDFLLIGESCSEEVSQTEFPRAYTRCGMDSEFTSCYDCIDWGFEIVLSRFCLFSDNGFLNITLWNG